MIRKFRRNSSSFQVSVNRRERIKKGIEKTMDQLKKDWKDCAKKSDFSPHFIDEETFRLILGEAKTLLPGDWWIEQELLRGNVLHGNVQDLEHFFYVHIYSEIEINIDGCLLYQFTEKDIEPIETEEVNDIFDAWVNINSYNKEADVIIANDTCSYKLRRDLTNLIPKITEMLNVVLEFTTDFKDEYLDNNPDFWSV